MRERLDCVLVATPGCGPWVRPWLGSHAGGRLHIQLFETGGDPALADSCAFLAAAAIQLRRYDACLLPVSECNLAWVRTALSSARGMLATPLLSLVRQLKAAALNDLYALGVADFARDPFCIEELRVRIERLLDDRRYPQRAAALVSPLCSPGPQDPAAYAHAPPGAGGDAALEQALCANILERSGHELEAYAIASATRSATSRESFRAAKSKVVERFERAYISAALDKHSGNIAMAARAAQKHRRAFWALMRKHQIDAAPYRPEPQGGHPRRGGPGPAAGSPGG
ncbi:helix-turn-helix domain-containing protein [Candidimonas nitroreducens]|uniref:helix-turn-helix domain-containing protein n=1 Tax=Candidimonas nitroreducens TaxID=683354 RepID=UPI0011774F6E|nr:helix-turn-helix domain-containing protein [Candidimonas nitroreducens]